MRFWRKGWVVLTTLVRLLGVALSLGLWMIAGVLRVFGAMVGETASGTDEWRDLGEDPFDYDSLGAYPGKRPRNF